MKSCVVYVCDVFKLIQEEWEEKQTASAELGSVFLHFLLPDCKFILNCIQTNWLENSPGGATT